MRHAAAFVSLSLLLFAAPAAAQTPAAAPVLLRYRYAAGEHHRYLVRSTSTAPAPIGRMVTSMHADMETRSVAPDGSAVIRSRFTGVELTSAMIPAAAAQQIRQGMEGMSVEVTQDARGVVTAHQPATGVSPQLRPIMDGLMQSMEQMGLWLPENPVRVGESWRQTRTLHLPLGALGALDLDVNVTYTLRALRGPATARRADIAMVTAITMAHPMVIQGVTVEGSGNGTGTLTFDVNAGALHDTLAHVTMLIHTSAGGQSQDIRTQSDSEMRPEGTTAPAARPTP